MAAVPYMELKDKYGNDVFLGHCGDIFMPAYPTIQDFRQQKEGIRDLYLKPNDVIVAGFPKTGAHWNCEIAYMLIQGNADYHKESGFTDFLDMVPVNSISNPADSPPRVFLTHLNFHHLPKQVWEKKVKVIHLERNPKDTWVSLYNHTHGHKGGLGYSGTWAHYFDLAITLGYWYGDWFDYVLDWETAMDTQTEVDIFTSMYEDLKRDPVGQIEKMGRFLGYPRDRELCEKIADACSFTKLKDAKRDAVPEEQMKTLFKDNATGFYRKGEVGDWKNWFTVAQNERFDDVYGNRMEGSKLRYTFVQ